MRLLLWQWRAEMKKMLARKRTYIGFGAFILLEVVLFIVFHLDKVENLFRRLIQRQGEAFDSYYSALTLACLILQLSVFLLGAIYLTLVAGDVVAKESEDGNLRLILTRPISRVRLLALKFASCLVYSFVLIQFIAWSALLLGGLLRGWNGGLFVFPFGPDHQQLAFFDAGDGLKRYALGTVLLSLSMMTASSMAFFFSCLPVKPSAATITALSYLFMDTVLRQGQFMENYKYLLVTHYMITWHTAFSEVIPWATIIRHYTVLGAVSLTLFVMGAAIFESRDVKS